MRVAFHFFSMAVGGVEKSRIALAHELLARGHAVDFVLVQAKGDLMGSVPAGVRIVDLSAGRTLASIAPLVRYLRSDPPDAMIASMGPQNLAAIVARRLARSKVWLGVEQQNALSREAGSNLSFQQRLVPISYRLALRHADLVIACSAGVADDLAATTGYPRGLIDVIYNPGCPTDAQLAAIPSVSHPFFASGVPVLFGAGRLVGQKDWDTAIRAFARVVEQRDARLIIAGVGPLEAELRATIAALDLVDKVALVGFQPNTIAWMAAADLFVLSSRFEGFGIVLVEALAAGTPIVSTDCEFGPSEILDGGTYGTLVPIENPEALAAAIVTALDAPADPARLVARARHFNVASVVDHLLTVMPAAGFDRD